MQPVSLELKLSFQYLLITCLLFILLTVYKQVLLTVINKVLLTLDHLDPSTPYPTYFWSHGAPYHYHTTRTPAQFAGVVDAPHSRMSQLEAQPPTLAKFSMLPNFSLYFSVWGDFSSKGEERLQAEEGSKHTDHVTVCL